MMTMLLIGAFATGFGKSLAEKSAMSSGTEIQKIITESVKYPDFGYKKGLHGDVVITFTLSAEGTIELKKITSSCDELKDYVKTELGKITIKDVIHQLNQQYKLTLKFDLS
jgi:hypothetical protein